MRHTIVTLTAVGLVMTAATAGAQDPAAAPAGPTIGVHAGLSLPVSDAKTAYESGFIVGAHVGFTPAALPVGLRVSGNYERFKFKANSDANTSIIGGDLDAIFKLPMTTISPYIIGGVAVDNVRGDTGDGETSSTTKLGYGIGGGVLFNLSGFNTFVQAKYRSTRGDEDANGDRVNFTRIPIIFGISFGFGGS
jgi:opacity protein-like surface antigen